MPKKSKYADDKYTDIDEDDEKLSDIDDKDGDDDINDIDEDEDLDEDQVVIDEEDIEDKNTISENDSVEDYQDLDEVPINDLSNDQTYLNKEFVLGDKRISRNRLTKYELVRILGERTKQLSVGAQPLIQNVKDLSYEKISEEELKANMIPYKLVRPTPSGAKELWFLDELHKDHLFYILKV